MANSSLRWQSLRPGVATSVLLPGQKNQLAFAALCISLRAGLHGMSKHFSDSNQDQPPANQQACETAILLLSARQRSMLLRRRPARRVIGGPRLCPDDFLHARCE